MRAPVAFATANIVFPRRLDTAWALYRLTPTSYDGLPTSGKLELLAKLARLTHSTATDLTLHRVTRTWSPHDYLQRAQASIDPRHGHPDHWRAHLENHLTALQNRQILRPEVWLAARLPTPARTWPSLREAFGLDHPAGITETRLRTLATQEQQIHQNIAAHFTCERATTLDLQWLTRRAFTRGLPEPDLDLHHRPQALILEDPAAELHYRPLTADLLRWSNHPITQTARTLTIETEHGDSHQAHLALGALPTSVTFPGPGAELLFAPLEAAGFGIDVAVCIKHVANDKAAALVRRKVVDADNIYTEESGSDHGASSDGARRPQAQRKS